MNQKNKKLIFIAKCIIARKTVNKKDKLYSIRDIKNIKFVSHNIPIKL